MLKYKLWEVGGKIRDQLLGLQSNDIDYSVVLEDLSMEPADALKAFVDTITEEGYEIFLVTESALTVRAKFPKDHVHSGVADFVLARKELGYRNGTREPIVVMGSLKDDLIRRDFTVNAIAVNSEGDMVDPFRGCIDLQNMILRTPTDAHITFNDDPLRILRALRFACTKGFVMSDEVISAIKTFKGDFSVVSTERVSSELNKMFKYNTYDALILLNLLRSLNMSIYEQLFPEPWKLNMTNKQ